MISLTVTQALRVTLAVGVPVALVLTGLLLLRDVRDLHGPSPARERRRLDLAAALLGVVLAVVVVVRFRLLV